MTRPDVVVSDTNVLLSGTPRDFLLDAAQADLVEVHWSSYILTEVARHAPRRFRTDAAGARELVESLNRFFPDALVDPDERVIDFVRGLGRWPDPDDIEVVAADADMVITGDIGHFPPNLMGRLGIGTVRTGDLLSILIAVDPVPFLETFRRKAAKTTYENVLGILVRSGARQFAETIGELTETDIPSQNLQWTHPKSCSE